MELRDRLFVITGAGNGIGRETAVQLLARGARVAAVDLSAEGLAETAEAVRSFADRFTVHELSITDREAVAALPQQVADAHGRPADGVINVAGVIQPFVDIVDLDVEEIERVMQVNFWGTVNVVRAFLPDLLQRPEALVMNFSSMGALIPVPGQGAYGASKAAVRAFTDALYAELDGTAVTVSLVTPGAIATNITQNSGVQAPGGANADDAASSKMKPMPVRDAGAQIVRAIESGTYRVLLGNDAKTFDRLVRLSPTKSIRLIAKKVREAIGMS